MTTVVPAADPSTTSLVFGLVFNLHGTAVPIDTNDIQDAVENGIGFELPGPVELGTLTDFTTWFAKQFGVPVPDPTTLPPPLDQIAGKLSTLDVTVTDLKVSIPGTKSPAGSTTQYKVGLSAMWPVGQGIPLVDGVLEIEGAVFGATNIPPTKPAPPTP